jgi:hypothetical protein
MEQTKELSKKTERLKSLDALRGFDMFWITVGSAIFEALSIIIKKTFYIGAAWILFLSIGFNNNIHA